MIGTDHRLVAEARMRARAVRGVERDESRSNRMGMKPCGYRCDCKLWVHTLHVPVEFEWDEEKRQKILAERSLDFADAFQFFDGRPVTHQPTPRGDEDRWKSLALFDGKFFTVVWMWRGAIIWVISMRRSHEQEERKYRAIYGGGT